MVVVRYVNYASLLSNSCINKLPNLRVYCIWTSLSTLTSPNSYSYYCYCSEPLLVHILTTAELLLSRQRKGKKDTAFLVFDPFSERPVVKDFYYHSLRFSDSFEVGITIFQSISNEN